MTQFDPYDMYDDDNTTIPHAQLATTQVWTVKQFCLLTEVIFFLNTQYCVVFTTTNNCEKQ